MNLGLRAKWSLTLGGLLTTVMTAGSLGIYWSERSSLLERKAEARTALVHQFAQSCADALLVEDELALLNAAQSLRRVPGVRKAYCRDPRGRILGEEAALGTAPDPDLQVVTEAISVRPGERAEVVVGFSRSIEEREVRDALQNAARRIVIMSAVALGFGIGAAYLLAGQWIKPIRQMAEATHHLARGHLSHRLRFRRRDELGELAADFDRMAERLGELDRMKEDFVSNVTHELRSPLSAIQSYVNLMSEDVQAGRNANTMDHLTVIRNNATRLAKFINDILDLAKIEAPSTANSRTPVDVGEIVKEVEALFRMKAREKQITLSVGPLVSGLTALAEEGAVHQVLTNLVSNALKFTSPGGRVTLTAVPTVTAETDPLLKGALPGPAGAQDSRAFVRVSVADTGPGIAEGDLERIFDRFEQVKAVRESLKGLRGTGLGLAISRGLAEAGGGRLLAQSVLGQGSVFHLYLQRVP